MHRLQRQRFQDEHIQRALDEITRLVWHKPSSPWLPGGAYASSSGCQEEKPPKFMRKRPENSWWQANSQGIWRKFGAKTESNMVQKTAERPGRAPCVPNAVRESHVSTRRRCCASQECSSSDPPLREPNRRACRDESIRDRKDEKPARGRMSPQQALEPALDRRAPEAQVPRARRLHKLCPEPEHRFPSTKEHEPGPTAVCLRRSRCRDGLIADSALPFPSTAASPHRCRDADSDPQG